MCFCVNSRPVRFSPVVSRRVDWQPCAAQGDILIGLLFGNQLSRHCRETKRELAVLSAGLRSAGIHRPAGQAGEARQAAANALPL